jgi:winged helix-turn-helix DNA-binding protein
MAKWNFLTHHAQVLVCIAQDPGIRLRQIGDAVGITERAAHRIVSELDDAGYISRTRNGRRNNYTIQSHLPLPDPLARERKIGDFLAILVEQRSPELETDQTKRRSPAAQAGAGRSARPRGKSTPRRGTATD